MCWKTSIDSSPPLPRSLCRPSTPMGVFIAARHPSYVRTFPISSAFCRAVRTSLASEPNCFPAALMLCTTSEKSVWRRGIVMPRTFLGRLAIVRPSSTPPAIPAAAPNVPVAAGTPTL
jgi:hypothetical protein